MKNPNISQIKGKNRQKGAAGEAIALKALKKHRYKIIDQNFSCSFGEIDIIATQKDYLVFVEVKLRENVAFGLPREAVDLRKQRKIIRTAQLYIMKHRLFNMPIRFDIVEVTENQTNIISNAFEMQKFRN